MDDGFLEDLHTRIHELKALLSQLEEAERLAKERAQHQAIDALDPEEGELHVADLRGFSREALEELRELLHRLRELLRHHGN